LFASGPSIGWAVITPLLTVSPHEVSVARLKPAVSFSGRPQLGVLPPAARIVPAAQLKPPPVTAPVSAENVSNESARAPA
jgi:hypothetical protein